MTGKSRFSTCLLKLQKKPPVFTGGFLNIKKGEEREKD
jgi:hypothetical protein